MTLTVPRAGTTAGRSASIRVADPQIGEAVAQFGAALADAGKLLEADRLDRQRGRDRLDLSRRMADLRLEADQIGDPDELDSFWARNVAAERDNFLRNVDPKLRPDAELEFDGMALPHATAIGQRGLGLRRDQRSATFADVRAEAIRQFTAFGPTDPAGIAAFDRFRAAVADMVARGDLPADKGYELIRDFRADGESSWATLLLDQDPQLLKDTLEDGSIFTATEPKGLATLSVRADNAIAARAAVAAAAEKSDRAAFVNLAEGQFREARDVFRKGRAYAAQDRLDALLEDPEIAALPAAQEYARAALLHEMRPAISAMPLAEKRALLAGMEAQPILTADEARAAEAVRENIEAHEAAVRQNPWAYAEGLGVVRPAGLPDPSAPEFGAALRQRLADRKALEGSGLIEGPAPVFRPEEVAALASLAAPEASPADRAAFAAQLAQHLPAEDMERAASELKADPVFGHIGTGIAAGVLSPMIAREAFEGQRIIERKDVSLPSMADQREVFFENMPELFADGTALSASDESPVRDALITTAQSIYAYKVRGNPDRNDGRIHKDVMLQSLHEAAGGVGRYGDARNSTGGIGNLTVAAGLRSRAYQVFLPPGVSAAKMQKALDGVGEALAAAPRDQRGNNTERIRNTALARISATGSLPDLRGEPIDAATWRRMRWEAVDGGTYRAIYVGDDGTEVQVFGDDGQPWRIDASRLLRAPAP